MLSARSIWSFTASAGSCTPHRRPAAAKAARLGNGRPSIVIGPSFSELLDAESAPATASARPQPPTGKIASRRFLKFNSFPREPRLCGTTRLREETSGDRRRRQNVETHPAHEQNCAVITLFAILTHCPPAC